MNTPVIFLAFANDQDEYLNELKEEARALEALLRPLEAKGVIKLIAIRNADMQDIFNTFVEHKDRIVVFHYGGHANGTHLRMEDADADGSGLGLLLSQQKALRLVFLNGCATEEQVLELLDLKIKAIIGTQAAINDTMAREFSAHFYQSLLSNYTLKEAFEHAKGAIITEFGDDSMSDPGKSRSLKWSKADENPVLLPWTLSMADNLVTLGDWKMPQFVPLPPLPEHHPDDPHYFEEVLYKMIEYEPGIQYQLKDRFGRKKDPKEYPFLVIENFPWTVSAQIRKVCAVDGEMEHPGMVRLKQLVYTYSSTIRFLAYTLLSQMWDERRKGRLGPLGSLSHFFPKEKETMDLHSYLPLLEFLSSRFKENDIEAYLGELPSLSTEENETPVSFQFLESVQKRLREGGIVEEEVTELCKQGDYQLSVFLQAIAFLVTYRLYAIKNIDVVKFKHLNPVFNHTLGILHAVEDRRVFYNSDKEPLETPTDSYSILLVRHTVLEEAEHQDILNLSPFVIDRHVFKSEHVEVNSEPNIFMFTNGLEDEYHFLTVNHSINQPNLSEKNHLAVTGKKEDFSGLVQQFLLFEKDVLAT